MRRAVLAALVCLLCLAAGALLGAWAALSSQPAPAVVPPAPGPDAARLCPDDLVRERFHEMWYADPQTWEANRWFGIPTQQNPLDAWVLQEILWETKPDVVVECGAYFGGSALLWATLLEQVNPAGRVISIDIEDRMGEARERPVARRRVDYLVGSSTAPEIVAEVRRRTEGKRVLVLLDSLHTRAHVLEELRLYAPLVPVGGYLVVQDTNLCGYPLGTDRRGKEGPHAAVEEFLASSDAFAADKSRERLVLTFCPDGFLKRVK